MRDRILIIEVHWLQIAAASILAVIRYMLLVCFFNTMIFGVILRTSAPKTSPVQVEVSLTICAPDSLQHPLSAWATLPQGYSLAIRATIVPIAGARSRSRSYE